MVINTDLRLAIRSAVAERKEQFTWQQRSNLIDQEMKRVMASPRYEAKIRAAKKDVLTSAVLSKRAADFFNTLGLSGDGSRIYDDDKFYKAGGRIPEKVKPQTFDQIMAQLAAATTADGQKLLKKLGINWSSQ